MKNPRKIWLATTQVRDYADPTEPNLYPEKYTPFIELEPIREFLQWCSYETERVEEHCTGSHSQYSSMANDDICKKCGAWEDGPGNTIISNKPTKKALEAKRLLEFCYSTTVAGRPSICRVKDCMNSTPASDLWFCAEHQKDNYVWHKPMKW